MFLNKLSKKATSNISAKAISFKLVMPSLLILMGGGVFGSVPWALCWIASIWPMEGLGRPSGRGGARFCWFGADRTVEDTARTQTVVNLKGCIL